VSGSIVTTLLILTVVIYLLVTRRRRDVFKLLEASEPIPIGDGVWTARMGWRYIAYVEGDAWLSLPIEPMFRGHDIVYVPDEENWLKEAPPWARERRGEILQRLMSVAWNRNTNWLEGKYSFSLLGPNLDDAVPNTLEAMPGGRALENMRMFEPGSKVPHEQAHKLWHEATRMAAQQASGEVSVYSYEMIPNSVFKVIVLPTLKENPRVTISFK
jgi:hypothetical protein